MEITARNSATSYAKSREEQAMALARQIIALIDDNAVLLDGDEPATDIYRSASTYIKHEPK